MTDEIEAKMNRLGEALEVAQRNAQQRGPEEITWCEHCGDGFTLEDIADGDIVEGVCTMCRKAGKN